MLNNLNLVAESNIANIKQQLIIVFIISLWNLEYILILLFITFLFFLSFLSSSNLIEILSSKLIVYDTVFWFEKLFIVTNDIMCLKVLKLCLRSKSHGFAYHNLILVG